MRYILDKHTTENGKYTPDWELDVRIDILKAKYSYKKFTFTEKDGSVKETHTVRIADMRQLQEFADEIGHGEATVLQDPGLYISQAGWQRVVVC